jgi:hypothetical protein
LPQFYFAFFAFEKNKFFSKTLSARFPFICRQSNRGRTNDNNSRQSGIDVFYFYLIIDSSLFERRYAFLYFVAAFLCSFYVFQRERGNNSVYNNIDFEFFKERLF